MEGTIGPFALYSVTLAEMWAARTGQTVWLTSLNDHVHMRGSLHYADLAVDLDTEDAWLDSLAWFMRNHIGHAHVQVIRETDHIHVELDNE